MVDGRAAYQRTLVARGVRAGDIKPASLDKNMDWDDAFRSNPLTDTPIKG